MVRLQQFIAKEEQEVAVLKDEWQDWQEKRQREAQITLLTPAERAQRVEQEAAAEATTGSDGGSRHARTWHHPLQLTPTDLDSIFDYLFEIGQAPPASNVADMGGEETTDMFGGLMEQSGIKEKLAQHPDILAQQRFTQLEFTKTETRLVEDDTDHHKGDQDQEDDQENGGGSSGNTYRYCSLVGTVFQQPFSVSFHVNVASLALCHLSCEVPMELFVNSGQLISRIQYEANLLMLFRLLQHYGKLESTKGRTFDFLQSHYQDTDVIVTQNEDDPNCLRFDTKWDDIQLALTWTYKSPQEIPYDQVDVNICEQLLPHVQLVTEATEWRSIEFDTMMNQIPPKFEALAKTHGVLTATQMIVGVLLQEPHAIRLRQLEEDEKLQRPEQQRQEEEERLQRQEEEEERLHEEKRRRQEQKQQEEKRRRQQQEEEEKQRRQQQQEEAEKLRQQQQQQEEDVEQQQQQHKEEEQQQQQQEEQQQQQQRHEEEEQRQQQHKEEEQQK
ncbi:unnamed protein product [Absidia cylindrospora]